MDINIYLLLPTELSATNEEGWGVGHKVGMA